jgi:hypothetical protein
MTTGRMERTSAGRLIIAMVIMKVAISRGTMVGYIAISI